jgi:hypothetical protein
MLTLDSYLVLKEFMESFDCWFIIFQSYLVIKFGSFK